MTRSFPSALTMWLGAVYLLQISLWTAPAQASWAQEQADLMDRIFSYTDARIMPSGPMREGGEGGETEDPLKVTMSLALLNVVKANTATNEVDLVVWTGLAWKDERLRWGPGRTDQFENISTIDVPKKLVWLPDIVSYSDLAPEEIMYPEQSKNLKLSQSGEIFYYQAKRIRVMCDLAGLNSESGSVCQMKFSSWMNSGFRMDLGFMGGDDEVGEMDMSSYFEGSKIEVTNSTAKRNVVHFSCCPEPYPDLTYTITIRSKERQTSSWRFF